MLATGPAVRRSTGGLARVGLHDEAGRPARPGSTSPPARGRRCRRAQRARRRRTAPHAAPGGAASAVAERRGRSISRRIDARAASSPTTVMEMRQSPGGERVSPVEPGRAPIEAPRVHRRARRPSRTVARARQRCASFDEHVELAGRHPRNLQQRRHAGRAVAARGCAERELAWQDGLGPAIAWGQLDADRRAAGDSSDPRNAICDVGGVTAGRSRPAQTTGSAIIAATRRAASTPATDTARLDSSAYAQRRAPTTATPAEPHDRIHRPPRPRRRGGRSARRGSDRRSGSASRAAARSRRGR